MSLETATADWKSFPLRVRRRRAARLALQAAIAADSGRVEDARACLVAARRLMPGLATLPAIQARIEASSSPTVSAGFPIHLAIATLVMVVLATIAMSLARPPIPTAQDFRAIVPAIDAARSLTGH